jgi:hypothetical protein
MGEGAVVRLLLADEKLCGNSELTHVLTDWKAYITPGTSVGRLHGLNGLCQLQ